MELILVCNNKTFFYKVKINLIAIFDRYKHAKSKLQYLTNF